MKSIIKLALAALVFFGIALNAEAANNTDMGQNSFIATIAIPITVTPLDPGSIDLGLIAPGTTKTWGTPTVNAMTFEVWGGAGLDYELEGEVDETDNKVTLNDIQWDEDPGQAAAWAALDGPSADGDFTGVVRTFPAGGKDNYRVYPGSMTAQNNADPADGGVEFNVTLTATYKDVFIP
jgi:hypothetical protein